MSREISTALEAIDCMKLFHLLNESTAGADASVEALNLYHMKLTLALIQ